MNKIYKLSMAVIVLTLSLAAVYPAVSSVSAATAKDNVCTGVGNISGGAGCTPPKGQKTIDQVIQMGVNLFSSIVGIVAIIMIIAGGFKYITAGGDANSISSAKNTIMYALIGLIIAAMAQVIARFVLKKVTS